MRLFPLALGAMFAGAMPHTAFATSANTAAIDSGDTAWILTATALVLMMTLPGLALFYAGLGSGQECCVCFDASFCPRLSAICLVGGCWLFTGFFR